MKKGKKINFVDVVFYQRSKFDLGVIFLELMIIFYQIILIFENIIIIGFKLPLRGIFGCLLFSKELWI